MGWCVQSGDFDALRTAIQYSNVFWGGRYNPIIPADQRDLADQLIMLFRVDVLWPLSRTADVASCLQRHPHLINPFHHERLFVEWGEGRRSPLLVDIYHPILQLRDELARTREPRHSVHIVRWDDADPLRDIMAIHFGVVPPAGTTSGDYIRLITDVFQASEHTITPDAELPSFIQEQWPISSFSHAFMHRHYAIHSNWGAPGFYIGDATAFTDLVTFWNLRATDASVIFFDPNFTARFAPLRSSWRAVLEARPPTRGRAQNTVAVWSQADTTTQDMTAFGASVQHHPVQPAAWNGMNIKAPIMYFSEGPALASVEEITGRPPRVTFPLPRKPLHDDDRLYDQHLVASIDPGIGLFRNERYTIDFPFLPQLNEYYGRNVWFNYSEARAEPETIGIICDANKHDLSISALLVTELVTEIFKLAGITANASQPGLIATRLISQMADLQGCRPFKIPGVRKLLEEYGPDQHFTWSGATLRIRDVDPATGVASLDAHTRLYIDGGAVTAERVFRHLLAKEVFRAGLRLDCPSCQLSFWLPLDLVRTQSSCEYCGHNFNVTPFLKDRGDWAFRRSGLFGRSDNLEGAVPVVLTLQQLDTALHRDFMYTSAMNLTLDGPPRLRCETDFVVLHRNPRGKIDIAVGEAKSRMEITDQDVSNLAAVAAAFPREKFNPYVVFSKLVPFNDAEITRIRRLNDRWLRAIMFTPRELEPYFLYERTATEFEINRHAVSLEDMARVTAQVYFR
jgi:hypothetical protein